MTVDLTVTPPVDRSRKAEILLGRDLAMMATAAKYDLAQAREGTRSFHELTCLFFRLADALRTDMFIEVTDRETTLDDAFGWSEFKRAACRIASTGAPKAVLTGARHVLGRTALMMIEVEDRRYWSGQRWPRPQVLSYLFDLGLVPVARDFRSRYVYDILLLRGELLDSAEPIRGMLREFNSTSYQSYQGRSRQHR